MTDAPAPLEAAPEPSHSEAARFGPHGPGGATARGFLVIALITLPLGLVLPMMETTRLLVFKDAYSLLDAVATLYRSGEAVLASVILIFSIVTPGVKALALWLMHVFPPSRSLGALRAIERLGKWSMMDVLIAALVVVLFSGQGSVAAASLPGLYLFTVAALALMIASGRMSADFERPRSAP